MSRRRSGLLCAGTGPVACVVHSLALEVRHAVSPRYVQRTQRAGGVDDLQRDNVVSWLLALNAHMSFSEQTFFLAVNYLDRFLSAVKVRSGHLQLLMAVCFLLASKVQEESDEQPTLAELVRVSNYAYGVSDLLRMETIVCEKLNWEFSSVTPLNFLHQFVELTQVAGTLSRKKLDHILKEAVSNLEQTCLYDFLRYPPSLHALCALELSIRSQCTQDGDKVVHEVWEVLKPHITTDPTSEPYRLCSLDMKCVLSEIKCKPLRN
eukprot:comp21192_c0_seq1/m.28773 comp21192_c0_seq1/g.28773  ORF comp21192_c0_seq1/g.28773 comp21192_c0_seq1/m.28773 type:complete len:264 (-) comp21192_c0_seq1:125-916(-)